MIELNFAKFNFLRLQSLKIVRYFSYLSRFNQAFVNLVFVHALKVVLIGGQFKILNFYRVLNILLIWIAQVIYKIFFSFCVIYKFLKGFGFFKFFCVGLCRVVICMLRLYRICSNAHFDF